MLAVNGEVLNMSDESNPYVKKVLAGYKEIKSKYRFPLVFKYPERFKIPPNPNQPKAKTMYKGGAYVRYTASVPTAKGTELWTYYENMTPAMNGQPAKFMPFGFTFQGRIQLTSVQMDLAYFLIYCCPFCENSLNQTIANSTGDKYFLIEDRNMEALEKYSKSMSKTDAEYLLSHATTKKLREIGPQFGISNSKQININDPIALEIPHDAEGNITGKHNFEENEIPYVLEEYVLKFNMSNLIREKGERNPDIYTQLILALKGKEENDEEFSIMFKKAIDSGMIYLEKHGDKFYSYHYKDDDSGNKGAEFSRCQKCNNEQECFDLVMKRYPHNLVWKEMIKRLLENRTDEQKAKD